ncbi:long-chain acyl-CoA synthetase [Methylomarinovum caldicuralii]|uniref:Long-chain acyl-CoA synthetase n=1 Tax=Methylomarinovum caldicuralii TaxID=438856 RepID=A0AAU9BU40_9GAMM|nr:AMP-binding protein [Methylomarinovum caldicuralii]BCX82458.1 long-chain acyl-CoA synthetase [Methylomarinovum caldicuralii]
MKSVEEILALAAETWPERPAILDAEGAVSYAELYRDSRRLKAALLQAGMGPGMGLGIMGRNSRHFVAAMFAGMGCGATVFPLSHQLKAAEIARILQDTGLHGILDDGHGIEPLPGGGPLPGADGRWRFSRTAVPPDRAVTPLADAAFVRYTSGTTGRSKGVVLSHRRILERVEVTRRALGLTPEDAVLWILPMAFHFLVTILVYIRSGAAIVLARDLLAHHLTEAANRHRATLLYASPMPIRMLTAAPQGAFSTLKMVISTSSAIPPAVARAFTARHGIPVVQAYGVIEAGLPLIDRLSAAADPETVGYPIAEFEAALFDDRLSPVAPGQSGRLALRGPGLFDAYLNPWQPAETVLADGWFLTGDLARLREDGRLVVCGREKDVINVAGNKVFPEEVEAILGAHPDVGLARVYGEPHPLTGEIVCAEVVARPGAVLDAEALRDFCRDRLSTYKVPQRLRQVPAIPLTPSGKVKRR